MQRPNLFLQILRLIPEIPVALYHVLKELTLDLIKFFVRPEHVAWPDPSAATRID